MINSTAPMSRKRARQDSSPSHSPHAHDSSDSDVQHKKKQHLIEQQAVAVDSKVNHDKAQQLIEQHAVTVDEATVDEAVAKAAASEAEARQQSHLAISVQQRLFALNEHVSSPTQLSIPFSTFAFFASYQHRYEALSVARQFISHQRQKCCPPTSYDPLTRSSYAVIDACATIGFASIALIKRRSEFHRVIACCEQEELYQALKHNINAYQLAESVHPVRMSFVRYYLSHYGDEQSKGAIVYWDTFIATSSLSLKLNPAGDDFILLPSINPDAFDASITLSISLLSKLLSHMLQHATKRVPMIALVVPLTFDVSLFVSLARVHAVETQQHDKQGKKLLLLAGASQSSSAPAAVSSSSSTSADAIESSSSSSSSSTLSISAPLNPYGALSQVIIASSHRQLMFLYRCKESTQHSHLYLRLKQIMFSQLWNKAAAQTALWNEFNRIMDAASAASSVNTQNASADSQRNAAPLQKDAADDEVIYDQLRMHFHHVILKRSDCADLLQRKMQLQSVAAGSSGSGKEQEEDGRAGSRVKEIVDLLRSHTWPTSSQLVFPPREMIDVGCSEGSITAALGRALNLAVPNIHGCDVRALPPTTSFTFRPIVDSGKLPYDDCSAQLIVSLMVFHHIETVQETMREIHRVLRPGGLLLLREHDLSILELATLIDVMHGLYARTWSDPSEQPAFCDQYYAHYRPRHQWKMMLEQVGFVECRTSPALKPQVWDHGIAYTRNMQSIRNHFQHYYALFEKKAS